MPVSQKKLLSNAAYSAKCDYIIVKPLKSVGADIRAAAASSGQSLQAYMIQAARERMTRDGFAPTSDLWPDYTTKG